jgi:succinoglycan biosynthesis protein ExoA
MAENANLPLVTVVLPIRNEADAIARGLEAILAQDYPSDRLEVLVADGMSTDGTRAIVESLRSRHPRLRLIDNPRGIVPTGLNAAIQQAAGEIIVRVDGHTEIAPDYVRQCVAELQRSGAENVGGRMTAVASGAFGQAVALATSSPFGVGGARFHYSDREEWVDTVYMGAWRREVFDRFGLFDEELVRDQDDEFNYRVRSRGGRILLSPRIRSRYTVRSTPHSLWRQYFQYGYWKVRVMQKHPGQMRPRHFAPPLFAASWIAVPLLAVVSPLGRVGLGLLAGSYLVANLASSIALAGANGWRHLRYLPSVFAILHLSYGLGFLTGLMHFAGRWGDRGSAVHGMAAREIENA